MANGRIRSSPATLFSQFPANGRAPFKQIVLATWAPFLALLVAIVFVLAIAFTADGQQTDRNRWYENAPTFIALAAVVLRGSLAGLLGVTLYQKLWKDLAAHPKSQLNETEEELQNTQDFGNGGNFKAMAGDPSERELGKSHISPDRAGLSIVEVDALHLASRMAVGMFTHPKFKAVWIIGALGLVVTSAIQPVLQSAISVRQEKSITKLEVPFFHPQLNGTLTAFCSANATVCGSSQSAKTATLVALMGKKAQHQYTDRNVTGAVQFGPVKFVDVECDVEAIHRDTVEEMLFLTKFYNFTYRFPDQENFFDLGSLTRGRPGEGRINFDNVTTNWAQAEIKTSIFNYTHFIHHQCRVQPAMGTCTTTLIEGAGKLSDLRCVRDKWLDVDEQVQKEVRSYFEPDAGALGIVWALIWAFGGEAGFGRRELQWGTSYFMNGAMEAYSYKEDRALYDTDMVSHMQRVLWNMPILSNFTAADPDMAAELTLPMTVFDQSNVILYRIDKFRVFVTLAIILAIAIVCLGYLSISRCDSLGRLMRDSLVHSLTVSGPHGPAIKGACMAGLDNIVEKAGEERLHFGVLQRSTQSNAGHLGFAENLAMYATPGSQEDIPAFVVGKPEKRMWYGDAGNVRERMRLVREEKVTC
ncbi:hypothetical protein BJ508DRAFT_417592 [Ascobolus immersus RN42]|uniref:Uncharacterized protein n=1 Tax=Ascobolus immersus RN42 TaxID=1160509 RepID=A0A3N4HWX7_ASCIM|nr:hypothetical protein BJ508DRAFT_417592 [Ascobolus immersus RN42]